MLVTGSYDEAENQLAIWSVGPPSRGGRGGSGGISSAVVVPSPVEMWAEGTKASVTQIEAIRGGHGNGVLVATSDGAVSRYHASEVFSPTQANEMQYRYQLELANSWSKLHQFPMRGCGCTTVSSSADGDRMVTGGEDGRLNVIRLNSDVPDWVHG